MLFFMLSLACEKSSSPDPEAQPPADSAAAADSAAGQDSARDSDVASSDSGDSGEAAALPSVWINELMVSNDSSLMDEAGQFPDWLELWNGGEEAVELSLLQLVDASGAVWSGGEGSLEPGEHLLLLADDQEAEGHLPFKLDADGETIELLWDGEVLDRVETGPTDSDLSWARLPDGGAGALTLDFTPGSANPAEPSASLDPSSVFFQREQIQEIRLTVAEEHLSELQSSFKPTVPGSLRWGDIEFAEVGVRLKGGGSYRTLDGKSGFKVDINEYVEGQSLRGMKGLTFNNANHDPTWTHEYLTYLVFRAAGYPAPRIGFTRLYLNEELRGLYIHFEDYDDRFLADWFTDSETSHFWEGAHDDFSMNHTPSYEYEEGPGEADEIFASLGEAFFEGASADEEGLKHAARFIDLDAFALFNALEAVTLQMDGYTNIHNFYLYYDSPSARFYWLTSGADYSWTSTYYGPWDGRGNHFATLMQSEEWAETYRQQLLAVADLAESLDLITVYEELVDFLAEDAAADPFQEHNELEIMDSHETTRSFLESWPAQLRSMAEGGGLP